MFAICFEDVLVILCDIFSVCARSFVYFLCMCVYVCVCVCICGDGGEGGGGFASERNRAKKEKHLLLFVDIKNSLPPRMLFFLILLL